MSTKAIREVLRFCRDQWDGAEDQRLAADALAELEAIERAAKDLDRLSVGDFAYNIRDRDKTMRETPAGQSTWEHPDVRAWSDASVLMQTIAKDAS
jgi:hypothetical protein